MHSNATTPRKTCTVRRGRVPHETVADTVEQKILHAICDAHTATVWTSDLSAEYAKIIAERFDFETYD